MIKIKQQTLENSYIVLVFLLSATLSQIISGLTGINNRIIQISPLFIICILILWNVIQNNNRFKVSHFISILSFIILSFVSALFHGEAYTLSMFLTFFVFPYVLLVYKPDHSNYLKIFQKVLNAFTVLLLSWILIDFLLESRFQLTLAKLLPNYSSLSEIIVNENSYGIYRAHTFFGHSLYTTSLFLLFAVVNFTNIICGKITKNIFTKYPVLIPIIMSTGLVLTNSKLGLFLGMIINIIYILYISKYKILSALIVTISVFLFLQSSFFLNNIWVRFQQVFISGDITNGRLGSFTALMESDFNFSFWGLGYEKNIFVSYDFLQVGINFENPLVIYLIDFGVIYLVFVVFYILMYVPFQIYKNMGKVILLLYCLWITFVFSFNSIGLGASHLIFPLTSVFWFLVLSKHINIHERSSYESEK